MKNSVYLERYAEPKKLFNEDVSGGLGIIVTIPCFNEPDLIASLEALKKCTPPTCAVEVIVVINQSEDCKADIAELNTTTYKGALEWSQKHSNDKLHYLIHFASELPKKHAGVGLARKIAMDEAARRFESIRNSRGIIVCFDADSLCDDNYLVEIEKHFKNNDSSGCSIYFEHPLSGNLSDLCYQAIEEYELHLRYYVNALRFAGLPYAYHTVGSSMAVVNHVYQKCGGMNKRKAGEDFYFIHKVISSGNFGEINSTKVIPSPRQSDRVPFGTGRAVNNWIEDEQLLSYHPDTFNDLKCFINEVDNLFYDNDPLSQLPDSVLKFLNECQAEDEMNRIRKQSKTTETFRRHFFSWFDAFMVLKFVHFVRDQFHTNTPIENAARELLIKLNVPPDENMLEQFRKMDRASFF